MSYINRSLSGGEKIEAHFKLHWIAWFRTIMGLIVGFVFILAVMLFFNIVVNGTKPRPVDIDDGVLSLIFFIVFVGYGLIAFVSLLDLKCQERGLTNKRVIFKKGIISQRTEEIMLNSVETVGIDQGVIGRLLGYGVIKVTGRGTSKVLFNDVADPIRAKGRIENLI